MNAKKGLLCGALVGAGGGGAGRMFAIQASCGLAIFGKEQYDAAQASAANEKEKEAFRTALKLGEEKAKNSPIKKEWPCVKKAYEGAVYGKTIDFTETLVKCGYKPKKVQQENPGFFTAAFWEGVGFNTVCDGVSMGVTKLAKDFLVTQVEKQVAIMASELALEAGAATAARGVVKAGVETAAEEGGVALFTRLARLLPSIMIAEENNTLPLLNGTQRKTVEESFAMGLTGQSAKSAPEDLTFTITKIVACCGMTALGALLWHQLSKRCRNAGVGDQQLPYTQTSTTEHHNLLPGTTAVHGLGHTSGAFAGADQQRFVDGPRPQGGPQMPFQGFSHRPITAF